MNKKNITFLITGGTGFIGHLLADKILREYDNVNIILLVRDTKKATSIYSKYDNSKLKFIEVSVEDMNLIDIEHSIDYIIHCASVTKSTEMIERPVEVANGIVLGTKNMLEFAKTKKIKAMVYISSMEVYGLVEDSGVARSEEQLGNIDLTSTRSCYSIGKRMAEHYCHIYHQEYGVPVKIARLAQTFGVGVPSGDNRVFVQFARAVVENRNIVLHTTGMSMGNYCASEDVVDAIFTILNSGKDGEVYNVVNEENTMRICDMAYLVANKIAHSRISIIFETENSARYGYAPETGLRLSSDKLRGLGWKPTKSLEEMYRDLIDDMLSYRKC